jgi:hypothetical protein
MESLDEDVYHVLDRVYHIFNLSNIYRFIGVVKRYGNNWESHLISDEALDRAIYIGRGYNNSKKEEKP